MRILEINIQNFRKLLQCHIEFSEKTTLFVGANNSGINRWENGNNAPSKTMIVLFENYCKKHGITFER